MSSVEMRSVEVVRAGMLTTVQDLGRPGHAHLGVPVSGALDRAAHRLANRLVGNPVDAATLETTLVGCALRAIRPVTFAVTGAAAPVRVDGSPVAWGAPVRLAAGEVLDVGAATWGVRSTIAVAGGFDVAPVLGSRAADLLSGLGPEPLRDDAVLPVGTDRGVHVRAALPGDGALPVAPPPDVVPGGVLVLPLVLGPRDDWFTGDALTTLRTTTWTVTSASNRVGLRLDGPPLTRERTGELVSEGMVRGAVQVPPEGRPIVFLADHPVTGGYPVVGVVPGSALDAVAQAAPGCGVRFAVRAAHLGSRGLDSDG